MVNSAESVFDQIVGAPLLFEHSVHTSVRLTDQRHCDEYESSRVRSTSLARFSYR